MPFVHIRYNSAVVSQHELHNIAMPWLDAMPEVLNREVAKAHWITFRDIDVTFEPYDENDIVSHDVFIEIEAMGHEARVRAMNEIATEVCGMFVHCFGPAGPARPSVAIWFKPVIAAWASSK